MKKRFFYVIPVLFILAGVFAFSIVGASAASHANPWEVKHASLDSRVTSGYWAFDTYTERYARTGDRAFVLHFDAASYVTVAGASPAGGHHINALLRGSFTGWVKFKVAGGNFNPDTSCDVVHCTGDSILQGIQRFGLLTFGSSAIATPGEYCFAYLGGDHDNDAGDEMQQASVGVSCSILGSGNQGDIFV